MRWRVGAATVILLAGPAAAGDGSPLVVALPPAPGVLRGFDRDLFAQASAEAGLSLATVDDRPDEALDRLHDGRVDVAAGPYPAGGSGLLAPLPPVAAGGFALLKRRGDGSLRSFGDAAGKRLAPLPGSGVEARAAASGMGATLARTRPGFTDPYRDLAAGRLAALVGRVDEVAAAALARPDAFEVAGPPAGTAPSLAPAMRRGDPRAGALAAALERMRADGRLAALQRRWFGFAADAPSPPAR